MDLSRGMATKLVLLEERKNEVRAMGKFPTVLALTISALKPIFAPTRGGWGIATSAVLPSDQKERRLEDEQDRPEQINKQIPVFSLFLFHHTQLN
jgi:hypothetical protein